MPLYEYSCADCGQKFEKLRPMSRADAPVYCAHCGSSATRRAISLFAAVSKGRNGGSRTVAGAGRSCGSCAGTHCATCQH